MVPDFSPFNVGAKGEANMSTEKRSPNDQRSDIKNPNNPEHKDAQVNQQRQLEQQKQSGDKKK